MEIAEIWAAERDALLRYTASLTHQRADAEDLVQQAFLRALEHEEQLCRYPRSRVEAWLMVTVKRLWIDGLRRQSRLRPLEAAAEPSALAPYADADVKAWLNELPPDLRTLVRLRYLEGQTSWEIGQTLGMNAATVRTRLRSVVKGIREQWEDER